MKPKQIVVLLALIAFALRVWGLDFQPLWGDEGWSVYFATMPLPKMLGLTALDIHPPLYYALLHGWFALVGVGAESARLLSAAIGTLMVPAMYALGTLLIPAPTNLNTGKQQKTPSFIPHPSAFRLHPLTPAWLLLLLPLLRQWQFTTARKFDNTGW